ncbi:MAG TPA: sterol desaturase family protein [Methylomirabilota bacterium]|nr:sterol desaturase family protein [Methylomirabilota bacterium]
MTERPLGYERRFGRGWISGVCAVALGALGVGAVLCIRYPALLTVPDARALYPLEVVRFLVHLVLIGAFSLALLSIALSRRAPLALIALALVVAAVLLGGSQVDVGSLDGARYLGLDWFLLNVLVLAMLFVPLEQLFARLPQRVLRPGWTTDLAHFAVSHLLVQVTVLLTLMPAAIFFRWAVHPAIQNTVAAQPFVLQFVEILIVADLSEYAIHRLFHAVPFLWRFHAVHHSSEVMDWLAGSRMHLVDVVVTRALAFVPLYVLAFSPVPVYAYLVFVSFHAVFIHANVRFRFGAFAHVIATPQFHHWHHAAEPAAADKNFAVHLPVIDRLLGTYYMPPGRWPGIYGIAGNPVPRDYARQLLYPFTSP